MGPAILIASAQSADRFHDRAFSLAAKNPSVAWIGAAHGDTPGGFERTAGFLGKRYGAAVLHAHCDRADEARKIVAGADFVYLGGGDVRVLIDRLRAAGLDEIIRRRHADGAIVLGVSAGAIGLTPSWLDFPDEEGPPVRFPCLNAVDIAVDVHDEESDWEELRALLAVWAREQPDAVVAAYGIPSGGALELDTH
ncbi:MAG TPA: Type 1 glutamine amidotransferase-like domain-containing protein, partial [Polyangia bacterium]|nr:Type 1 glutamine amidotransferase-like domain-containing protein [Polyangia bacterium]